MVPGPGEDDDELFGDFPDQLGAKRARLAQLKELFTSTVLGIGQPTVPNEAPSNIRIGR